MRTNASIDLDGLLPSSTTELFIEMCARGQRAEWSDPQAKLVCVPDANPSFKMPVPRVTLRFQSDLDVAGGSFGNVDVLLTADFSSGIYLSGDARWVAGTSTAFGFDAWAPDFCEIGVTLELPNGGTPYLSGTSPRCSPYCIVQTDCVDAEASCVLGKCQVCGDDFCAFGENSRNCPEDCGYPAGSTCSTDDHCASDDCWTRAEQEAVLSDLDKVVDPGVCLPCDPGVSGCPPDKYCDPFQLYECRDKAPYGEYCAWNDVCQSGKCKFDVFWGGFRCADCWEEGDCGAGEWCDWYTATPNPVPEGFSVAPTYQCRGVQPTGGKCGYDAIVGANDDHCEPGNFCDVDGTCHSKAEDGVLCTGDRVCESAHCCFKGIGWFCGGCCEKADCANPEEGCYDSAPGSLYRVCRPGDDGEACSTDQECASDNCVAGYCQTRQPNGFVGCNLQDDFCQSGHCCVNTCRECCYKADCGAGLGCYDFTCRKGNDGEQCVEDAECASNNCVANYCQTKQPNGFVGCNLQDDFCQSGHCCGNTCEACCADADCSGASCYRNTTTGRNECRLGYDGEPCDAGTDCEDGICSLGTCGCNYDSECPGSRCYTRDCRFGNEGEPCDHASDCVNGVCCGAIGGTCNTACYCNTDLDCPGLRCYSHQCRLGNPTEPCDSNDDCYSGSCTSPIFGKCN